MYDMMRAETHFDERFEEDDGFEEYRDSQFAHEFAEAIHKLLSDGRPHVLFLTTKDFNDFSRHQVRHTETIHHRETVFCRECRFREPGDDWCCRTSSEFRVEPRGFCAWGERV